MKGHLQSHLALFVVQLMYGANYVVAKGLMGEDAVVGPNGFILIRVIGAVSLFWAISVWRKEKITRKDFGRLALCGLFGVALNQLMFFNGLNLTSPLNASVIMITTPIIVLLLSAIILKERMKPLQLMGVLIGAVGAVFFILQNSSEGFASSTGDIFILLNATSYSFYLVLVKPLMNKYSAITVISWVFTFGLLYVIIWIPSGQEAADVSWTTLTNWEMIQMAFVVVGVTFVPYLLNVFAMKNVSPSVTAVYIYLQPILAAVFVYLYSIAGMQDYSGDMTISKGICALLVFAGVYLVIKPDTFKKKKQA